MSEDKKNEEVTRQEETDNKKTGKKSPEKKGKRHKEGKSEELEQALKKLEEINDKYLRLYSEFDNYRKRTLREKSDLIKTASEEVITSLLPVLDDLERAISVLGDEGDPTHREGMKLIYNKFFGILQQKGLEVIESIGQPFDVDFHEAITNIPAPSEDLKGKVIDEIQKGYTLNGKVIRFSRVVVGA
jgi:molecular chaperone GrpE